MFEPDYRNIEDCARNKKPRRIPLYEHGIDDGIMEGFLGKKFAHLRKSDRSWWKPCGGCAAITIKKSIFEIKLYVCGTRGVPRGGTIRARRAIIDTVWGKRRIFL